MTSKDSSARPGADASATSTRTCGMARASSAVNATMRGEASMPSTEPPSPVAAASGSRAAPRPHPMSSTRSPGCTASSSTRPRAMGWNHGTPTSS